MKTADDQRRKMAYPGANQGPATPGPVTRVLPKDAPSSALLEAQEQGHPKLATTNHKGQCFHARLPVQDDLKMLKVQTLAHKDEAPRQGRT